MSWIAVGVAGGSALLKVGHGLLQNHQASEIEKNNIRPTMAVEQGYKDNVAQADQMSRTGIPQQQYDNSLNNINRNQAGGLYALGRSSNPGAGLASIVRAGNDATNNLDAQDAVARNRNLLNLMQNRTALAQQQKEAWNYNHANKYSEGLAQSQALRGAGSTNISSGLNDVGQVGINAGEMGVFNKGLTAGELNGTGAITGARQGGITAGMVGNTDNEIPGARGAGFGTQPNMPYFTGWQQYGKKLPALPIQTPYYMPQ